jgi:hypothetical protein
LSKVLFSWSRKAIPGEAFAEDHLGASEPAVMEPARPTDTLLIDADGVYDLGNVNDRLLLGLKGQMSEIELHFLMGRLPAYSDGPAACIF